MTTPDRVAQLLARLEPPRRDEVAAIAGLDELLQAHETDATAAWPALAFVRERYLGHLATWITQRASEPAERVIRTMPAADLYLAAACAAGDAQALATFQAALVPDLRRTLAKLSIPAATLDEAVQRVLVVLVVGDSGAPQIATYAGRGTLRSWLRTIGVRTARRMLGDKHRPGGGDDELATLPAAVRDPELEMLRVRYADDVRRAFAAAFAQLAPRERNVLRQYYLDELTIDELAALYRVNRATTARWVAGARLAVTKATREALVEHAGVPASQVDSVIRLVRSQLAVSVRDLTG